MNVPNCNSKLSKKKKNRKTYIIVEFKYKTFMNNGYNFLLFI